MSCGNHHDTPCAKVLEQIYVYLDNEDCHIERSLIVAHLEECGPCNDEFDLEAAVKALIARACGCEPAPSAVYQRVVANIANIQVEITSVQKHIE